MTLPFRRRSDGSSSPHDRARIRAAERVDGALEPDENAWLERHLSECRSCRSVAEGFESDRLELRALRRRAIEPPRDLWARTAAAIEREAGRDRDATPAPRLRRSRPAPLPLGALAGLMVVAVVFGATLLSGRPEPTIEPRATAPAVAIAPSPTVFATARPTPLAVPRGDLDYLAVDSGAITIYSTAFSEVCPENVPECAPLDDTTPRVIEIPGTPEHAVLSPDDAQVVVVNEGRSTGADTVWVVPVPNPGGTMTPTPSPTPEPLATDVPATGAPTTAPSTEPPPTEPPRTEPPVTEPPVTDPPSTPSPSPTAPTTPIAVADDVIVVGSAVFNEDGTRFAFSARPADGSQGPDIFLWTLGQAEAVPVTDDHRSVFSGWAGDLLLASRAVVAEQGPDASPGANDQPLTAVPEAFVIDPETGEEAVVAAAPIWRPAVDPSGTFAVYWEGTLELDASGVDWLPGEGRLVVAPWHGTPALPSDEDEPLDASAVPAVSPAVTPPLPGGQAFEPTIEPSFDPVGVLADGPVRGWEARWDEDGSHLGVWIADPEDPSIGRLSLYTVDATTGAVDANDPELPPQWARPGFEIGAGHLAWATRDGQDGKGSHVKVVAWTDEGLGQVETKPAEDVLIVHR